MSVITTDAKAAGIPRSRPVPRPSALTAWTALTGRRLALSAHTPREVLAPLVTPILFALVIAPALAKMIPTAAHDGVDYRTFVIVGTVGLLIPLTCAFAGIGVIVDRTSGARRELLAAPVPRGLIVAGNLTVAVLTSTVQVGALILAGWARGASFDATGTGIGWFVAAVLIFTVFMYSVAEILANRIPTQEEYVGLTPVVAIFPGSSPAPCSPSLHSRSDWPTSPGSCQPRTSSPCSATASSTATATGSMRSGDSPTPPRPPCSACWC